LIIGHPSAASASRPASVIRTLPTSMSFPAARTFSYVRVAGPWLTRPSNIRREKPRVSSEVWIARSQVVREVGHDCLLSDVSPDLVSKRLRTLALLRWP
jgi:uncharacterized hydantoinase/oxoprolinase family protein